LKFRLLPKKGDEKEDTKEIKETFIKEIEKIGKRCLCLSVMRIEKKISGEQKHTVYILDVVIVNSASGARDGEHPVRNKNRTRSFGDSTRQSPQVR
jgi:hypothetical protein